ncbi:odorant receptor coreceptor-like [Schistocerca nitens]|uniref:odorant receptor coreceptor-like n=1 Tax=Schistocerca nitens TaxID=7011 RepID=UPI002117F83D|nr:odorant receptor coreceptor-like [Schistocerca nitens]
MTHSALFCFLGQSITDQSESLLHSAFSCGWSDADPPIKRPLTIIMLRTSRPLVIRLGKFFTLSRNTYMQIINTSYTIFKVLLSLQKRIQALESSKPRLPRTSVEVCFHHSL